MKTIKLLTNIMLGGQRVPAGSLASVSATVARDLIHRGRAVLAEAIQAPAPAVVPPDAPAGEPEQPAEMPTADEAPDAPEPRRRRRK